VPVLVPVLAQVLRRRQAQWVRLALSVPWERWVPWVQRQA